MTEREWDRHLHIRTIGREDESDPNYAPYEPTPYSVLERIAASGHVKRRHHLLDYGCGKGRVAFFMAAEVGCRATGVDHSEKLIDMARETAGPPAWATASPSSATWPSGTSFETRTPFSSSTRFRKRYSSACFGASSAPGATGPDR